MLYGFYKVIKARRSIRQYKIDPIPGDARLAEALNLVPSGSNSQPCAFIFVKDPAVKELLIREGCHQESFLNAPLIVVACCLKGKKFDFAIAVDHLILVATNEVLGSCWVGWIERDSILRSICIPQDIEVPVIVLIGYAEESQDARPRKSVDLLVSMETYKQRLE